MNQSIFFWGGKFKAGIIHNLIKKDKILADTSSLSLKYVFDPNLSEAQFECNAEFSNKKKDLEKFLANSNYFLVCIGNELGMARYFISKELEKKNIKPLEVISKNAYFEDKALLGKGIQLFPSSVVQTSSKIGDYSILNTGSILEHHCVVGNGVHIMPGAVVGGNVNISNYVTIGMNATIMPKVTIEQGAYIGAGAVVTKDVKKNEVVTGNPARFLKKIEHKFDLEFFK